MSSFDLLQTTISPVFGKTFDSCPHLRVTSCFLLLNGEIALANLEPGYQPILLIQDDNESQIPAGKWADFRQHPPTSEEIIQCRTRCPCADMELVCGQDAGFSLGYADADFKGLGVRP